jgi:sigma-B regulation protein RsbU (phosphoserine phosphatase)
MRNPSDIVVLFVDDEADILSSLTRFLRKEPYRKLFAETGKKALELLESNNVAIVISDYNMPDMNGMELMKRVKTHYPEIVSLIISGDNNVEQIFKSNNACDIFRVIPKPVEPVTLKEIINEAIYYYTHGTGE